MANVVTKIDVYISLIVSGIMFLISYGLYSIGYEMEFMQLSLFYFLFGCIISMLIGYLMKRNRIRKEPKI